MKPLKKSVRITLDEPILIQIQVFGRAGEDTLPVQLYQSGPESHLRALEEQKR